MNPLTFTRAAKSGLSRDTYNKIMDKFNKTRAKEVLEWISIMINDEFDTNGEMKNMFLQLKDGQKLCLLMNVLVPNKIKYIYKGEIQFKQMENISLFTRACKEYGLRDVELFQTCDLFEAENMLAVCVCIESLARKAQKKGQKGFGPKEAEKNERKFTKEQIQEGNKIIGLQYGNNKGASQKGLNIGNTRHM